MSEVDRMYENARVANIGYDAWDAKDIYPPFTAEKQIELIKWLIVHSPSTCLEDEIIVCAFEDSLANIINTMWQDLSEEERKQIREILE